jgi:hypothetical protein
MNTFRASLFFLVLALVMTGCGVPKSYFTVGVRSKVEKAGIQIDQLQFYVDRDVELRRELSSGETKVTSGKIKVEQGKYIHIILLKKFTPGVCTGTSDGRMDVSFEMGDGKSLIFGVAPNATPDVVYQIFANEWVKSPNHGNRDMGKITYDGETYYLQANGILARLMIKKSVTDKFEVERRVMKGRKID